MKGDIRFVIIGGLIATSVFFLQITGSQHNFDLPQKLSLCAFALSVPCLCAFYFALTLFKEKKLNNSSINAFTILFVTGIMTS